MARSQKTNVRGGKGSSPSGFHFAVAMIHAVGLLLGIGASSSRQPPAESQLATPQPVDMSWLIDSSRTAQTPRSQYSFPVPTVPLNLKVPAVPKMDLARLQRLLENSRRSSQENDRDNYLIQIQPYPVIQIQPYSLRPLPLKIAEPLKISEPLKMPEKTDVTIKLVPLQFTQRFQPSMRTDAPPAK